MKCLGELNKTITALETNLTPYTEDQKRRYNIIQRIRTRIQDTLAKVYKNPEEAKKKNAFKLLWDYMLKLISKDLLQNVEPQNKNYMVMKALDEIGATANNQLKAFLSVVDTKKDKLPPNPYAQKGTNISVLVRP